MEIHTPNKARTFWSGLERQSEEPMSPNAVSPGRSPLTNSRRSLQANAFIQMDQKSPFPSPRQSNVSPKAKRNLPFDKENNFGQKLDYSDEKSVHQQPKVMSNESSRAPLNEREAVANTGLWNNLISSPSSDISERDNDYFKFMGKLSPRPSDATTLRHPIDWSLVGNETPSDFDENDRDSNKLSGLNGTEMPMGDSETRDSNISTTDSQAYLKYPNANESTRSSFDNRSSFAPGDDSELPIFYRDHSTDADNNFAPQTPLHTSFSHIDGHNSAAVSNQLPIKKEPIETYFQGEKPEENFDHSSNTSKSRDISVTTVTVGPNNTNSEASLNILGSNETFSRSFASDLPATNPQLSTVKPENAYNYNTPYTPYIKQEDVEIGLHNSKYSYCLEENELAPNDPDIKQESTHEHSTQQFSDLNGSQQLLDFNSTDFNSQLPFIKSEPLDPTAGSSFHSPENDQNSSVRPLPTEPSNNVNDISQFHEENTEESENIEACHQDENKSDDEPDCGPQTIFATGTKIRARPSLTPHDASILSKIDQHQNESYSAEISPKIYSSMPQLELDFDGLSLENNSIVDDFAMEFDRVLETEKRGYKIRENKEVVYATSDRRKSERSRRISGPVKKIRFDKSVTEAPKLDPSLTAESLEIAISKQKRKTSELMESDRGRLFIRVLSAKKIGLPKINDKHATFSMVLCNGVQEISTPYRSLSENVHMEQEFELIAGRQLEFDLTLKAKWPKITHPVVQRVAQHSRTTSVASVHSTSSKSSEKSHRLGFSKLFGSSKKKTTEQPKFSPTQVKQATPPTPMKAPVLAKDIWEDLTGSNGSFGQVSIDLAEYESKIYGKPKTFDLPCYNRWSKSSKPGEISPSMNNPYQIGTLQVQMMFVPRQSKKDIMPHSISEALNEIRLATLQKEQEEQAHIEKIKAEGAIQEEERRNAIKQEGYLSQLGGDCTYWRRRYFKLDGPNLTAYSESSRKPRVSINLVKATRIVEDKSTLIEPMVTVESKTSSGGRRRRKSAFAEQEEAFMFVDSGFRIRFANGEIIDFYADDLESKKEWVASLHSVVAQSQVAKVKLANLKEEVKYMPASTPLKPWVELVLSKC